MTSPLLKSIAIAGVMALAACSSMPTTTPTLDQARADFVAANNDPQVATYAALEFKQAGDALDAANRAAAQRDSLETIDRLAYVAKQRIAAAEEVAKAKSAQAQIANAGRERDRVQSEVQVAEANRARRDAEAQTAQAQAQAADAQMQAQAAQQQAAALAEHSARLEALLSDLHAQKTDRGMVVTIGDVLFATDRADLNANGMASVRKLAEIMMQNPDRTVSVEGFTDSTGSAAHNQELSQRRAASVAQALTSMGVPAERVSTRGYGEAFPVASNDNAGNRQLNRRVEIVLSNDSAPIPPRTAQR